jgi:hypothetical protein
MANGAKRETSARAIWAGWRAEAARKRHERAAELAAKDPNGPIAAALAAGGSFARLRARAAVAKDWAKRNAGKAAVCVFAPILILVWAYACGAAAWAQTVASPDGVVWVNWAQMKADSAGAPAANLSFASTAKTPEARAQWDGVLAGSSTDAWRPVDVKDLLAVVPQTSLDACFEAGRCARLRTAWRPAFAAAFGAGRLAWEPSPDAGRALSRQEIEQIERSPAIVWFGFEDPGAAVAFAMALVSGFFLAMLVKTALAKATENNEDGPANLPRFVALAMVGEWALASVCFSVVVGALACLLAGGLGGDDPWLGPRLTQQAREAIKRGQAPNAQSVAWSSESEKALIGDFTLGERRSSYSGDERQAALVACESLRLCARREPTRFWDAAREAAGRPIRSGLIEAPAGEPRAAWERRDIATREVAAQTLVTVVAAMWLLGATVMGAAALNSSSSNAHEWLERLGKLAEAGDPLEERRALASLAKKAAKSAARRRKRQGEAPTAAAKKAPRI